MCAQIEEHLLTSSIRLVWFKGGQETSQLLCMESEYKCSILVESTINKLTNCNLLYKSSAFRTFQGSDT